MTRTEHLLWILAEESAEVAQRASKAARFTLTEVQPDQDLDLTNAERIKYELNDLWAVVEMLQSVKALPHVVYDPDLIQAKQERVEKFLLYSLERGTLETQQ